MSMISPWMILLLKLYPPPTASAASLGSLTLPRRPAASDAMRESVAPSLAS